MFYRAGRMGVAGIVEMFSGCSLEAGVYNSARSG